MFFRTWLLLLSKIPRVSFFNFFRFYPCHRIRFRFMSSSKSDIFIWCFRLDFSESLIWNVVVSTIVGIILLLVEKKFFGSLWIILDLKVFFTKLIYWNFKVFFQENFESFLSGFRLGNLFGQIEVRFLFFISLWWNK